MGAEAKCELRIGARRFDGRALLETDELIFRGEHKLTIKFTSIKSIAATNGVLRLDHTDGTASFTIGARADDWAEKIRSPKTRIQKLGVKSGDAVAVKHVDDTAFVEELAAAGATIATARATSRARHVFVGVSVPRDLARISQAGKSMADGAALWIIHPKGVAGVKDVDIFAVAKTAGLVYSKVARFSDTHTAEKLTRART